MVVLRSKMPGANIDERHAALWAKIQRWYETEGIENRLQNLTRGMIQSTGKAPKLRSNAGCCRALVPFGRAAAEELLNATCPVESQMIAAARDLEVCYQSLAEGSIFFADLLREHSMRFAQSYNALNESTYNPKIWRIKPKMHMWLELCSEGSKPSMFWCYRDEDWGGFVARAARRRSGVLSARSFSYNLNVRFRIYQPIMHKDVVSGLTSLYCSTRSRAEKVRRQKTCTRWYIDAAHVHHIKGTRVVPSYGCISIHDADL